jgi:hypothetical protein
MKKIIVIMILLALAVYSASAYTIDGNLNDWGLDKLSYSDWSSNSTWVPKDGVRFIVEDNHNPLHATTPHGVHISGTGSHFTTYNEPYAVKKSTMELISEPYGVEYFDLEALYFDQDDTNIYIAVVTSVDPTKEGDRRTGDIALNIDGDLNTGDLGYEYAVRLFQDSTQGDIVYEPTWQKGGYLLPIRPDYALPGSGTTSLVKADVVYTLFSVKDHDYDNYIVECCILKAEVGATGKTISINQILLCDNCINEHIFVPEFPTVAALPVLIVGLILVIYQRKRNL